MKEKPRIVAEGKGGWQRVVYGGDKTVYRKEHVNINDLWIKKALRKKSNE